MGMHFGILASELPSASLLTAIDSRLPRLLDQGPFSSLKDFRGAHDEGWDLAVGDLEGRGYMLDSSFLLSGMEPDLIADIAASSGKLLVGCGAETVSGSFYCVVVRGSDVRRHYFQCNADLAKPYSFGEPFPTEKKFPLDDLNGTGLLAVLKSFGFDYDRWMAEAEKRRVMWTADFFLKRSRPLTAAAPSQRRPINTAKGICSNQRTGRHSRSE